MTRSRVIRSVQIVLALVAVLCAVGVVRAEVVAEADPVSVAPGVAQGQSVDLVVSKSDAPKQLKGSFTVESIRDYPRLKPTSEHENVIERAGGRVVVAVIRCDCPVSDDLLGPHAWAIDAEGRRWDNQFVSADNYAETADLSAAYDLGEDPHIRYAEVFLVRPRSPGRSASSWTRARERPTTSPADPPRPGRP